LSLLLLLLGCPRPTPPPAIEPEWLESETEAAEVPVIVDSGEWLGDGVSVWIAPGWTGEHTQGPPERLALRESQTKTTLLFELGVGELALPRGCDAVFEDAGTYRSVALTELRTASCTTEDGALVQVWLGRADLVEVRVEARYPIGEAILGRQRVEEILATISPAGGA
jgi:hypothetical protein